MRDAPPAILMSEGNQKNRPKTPNGRRCCIETARPQKNRKQPPTSTTEMQKNTPRIEDRKDHQNGKRSKLLGRNRSNRIVENSLERDRIDFPVARRRGKRFRAQKRPRRRGRKEKVGRGELMFGGTLCKIPHRKRDHIYGLDLGGKHRLYVRGRETRPHKGKLTPYTRTSAD